MVNLTANKFKPGWKNETKTGLLFLLKLLILLCILKLVFFVYNTPGHDKTVFSAYHEIQQLVMWSILADMLVIIFINATFFIFLSLFSFFGNKHLVATVISLLFVAVNTCCILLNLADIFYFHFHLQRADADLLFVLDHPLQKTFIQNPLPTIIALLAAMVLTYCIFLIHKKINTAFKNGARFMGLSFAMLTLSLVTLFFGRNFIVPTYPLVKLSGTQLPFVQNSFHTFIYSLYRYREGVVREFSFLPGPAIHPEAIQQAASSVSGLARQKNVILFIMESVPQDFFDPGSPYKVRMPFFDSLLNESIYFNKAYSYSHNSNKGIVAILAGIPTLTEIPLYHSNYAGIKMTSIGNKLSDQGYQSAFFIGDNYDDFGFAKAVNWFGIQKYYSKEAIPVLKNIKSHTMGLHDEHVLPFMFSKVNEMKQPFFAVNFNISTHYPNNLPENYVDQFPQQNFSPEMKSMHYYSNVLQDFFTKASKQSWYENTVFIFCADHWMYPDIRKPSTDFVQSFRIPIIIHEPAIRRQMKVESPVSQLDIMNTILCIAGVKDKIISYGKNIYADYPGNNRVVFQKENAILYQALDSSYVLGFNIITGKPEYCYQYRSDKERKHNLIKDRLPVTDSLLLKLKLFLQTASWHYNKRPGFN